MDAYDITTRHLEALQAIARQGSFGKAAAYLGYSQAAISQQVARMEACIGMPVLERPGGRRAATLTEAGRLLLAHADAVLAKVGDLDADLAALSAGTGGRITCGVFQSVGVEFLPDIIRGVRAGAPDLEIRLVERDANEDLLTLLHAGELDLAFVDGTPEDRRLELIALGQDPFAILLPADGALADGFSLERLRGVAMIGQQDCESQRQIDDRLRAHGVTPRYLFRTNDNSAVQAMVRAGVGPAILPALAVDWSDDAVRIVEVPEIGTRTISLALPKGAFRPPSIERFITAATDVSAGRLAAQGRERRRTASAAAAASGSKRGSRAASSTTT